jgi:hypothetical protein
LYHQQHFVRRYPGLDDLLKVVLHLVAVGLGGGGLLFPQEHLLLVKAIAVVDFLKVKLKVVAGSDGDI